MFHPLLKYKTLQKVLGNIFLFYFLSQYTFIKNLSGLKKKILIVLILWYLILLLVILFQFKKSNRIFLILIMMDNQIVEALEFLMVIAIAISQFLFLIVHFPIVIMIDLYSINFRIFSTFLLILKWFHSFFRALFRDDNFLH